MKQIGKKNAKIFLLAFSLLLLTVVGLTVAYYNSQKAFKNEFHVNAPGVSIYEKFNPTDWWVPGEEKSKQAWFTNTGELDMLLRFKIDYDWAEGQKPTGAASEAEAKDAVKLYWTDSTNDSGAKELPIAIEGGEPVVFGDFIGFYDSDEKTTYYYYKKILKAKGTDGSSTQHVLESVKFEPNLSNDGHLHSDYSGTQIDLTITGETVLVDWRAAQEKWPNVRIDDTCKNRDENGKVVSDGKVVLNEDGMIDWVAAVNSIAPGVSDTP